MDMEMDVPFPDELELLEESYRFHEEEDFEPYPYEDCEAQPSKSESPRAGESPPSPETILDGNKRSRPSDHLDQASDEKRGRLDGRGGGAEEDEEWLRYSPSKVSVPEADDRRSGDSAAEKFVWRFASEIDGEFFPVTAPSGGDRVYTKLRRTEETDERLEKLDARMQFSGLIAEPISVLLQKADQEAFTKALQASSGDQIDPFLSETPVVHEQLWVDKYSPNSFTELLSDEHTNREVLLWLKQWDSCVFGSEVRSTSNEVLSALRRHSSIGQHQKFSNSNFLRRDRGPRWNKENFRKTNDFDRKSKDFDNKPKDFDHKDANSKGGQDLWNKKSRSIGPPEQKILLLCGPPGLGKTTLAHVAARHCGYRVVEINASDDRSSSTIEAKILDVVQMNSVTLDSRPKCLVIDEIDGSLGEGKGAVDVILKMVSSDLKSDTGKDNVDKEGNPQKTSSKKGRKNEPLSRPVICICNDLYAPVLRPLRQVAKVHVFVQPTISRVVSRLKYICNKEGMKPNSIGLATLAEYTECDIRSCLNTLQFLQKKKEALNVLEVSSQVVGRKDMSKSVFDIWKEVFQKKKCRRERRSNVSNQTTSSEFESLHSLISSRGDYDLIMDGVHENILQLHYHDPVMQKTVKCLNNLGVSDLLHQYAFRTQHMHLLAYQPAIAIAIHRQVAQIQRPNIEWPKSYQRYRMMLMEKKDSLRSWHHTIPPYISRHLSISSFVEDSVSLLLHILSPATLRPVALNLLSETEKINLDELVIKMVSYCITYKNVKSNPQPREPNHEAASDSSTLAFDPPITDYVNFKGYRSGHYVLALAMKQVLVHEVEKQRILLASIGRSGHLRDGFNKENQVLAKDTGRPQPDKPNHPVGHCANNIKANTKHSNPGTSAISCNPDPSRNPGTESVKSKSSGVAKRSFKDPSSFFDRFRKLNNEPNATRNTAQKDETSERDLRPVLFKFNEGFTNAVKRPVRIREFLQ